MINLQEANLPDQSLVVENNWNGILILAELNDWLEKIGDQSVAAQIFHCMLEELVEQTKEIDAMELAFWKPVYEHIGRS